MPRVPPRVRRPWVRRPWAGWFRRPPAWAVVVTVTLLGAGAAMIVAGALPSAPYTPPSMPEPSASAPAPARAASHAAPCAEQGAKRSALPPPESLPYSLPVRVTIPEIGVQATVIPLGENPNGTVAVPPLSEPWLTSWYDEGPAPGQRGSAALFGHVDVAGYGPGVFYRLGDLRPGDLAEVTRADHRVAVFCVYRIATYAKSAFPTMAVYGPAAAAELRLVTCGGPFDAATGHYLDNVIAFARLVAVRTSADVSAFTTSAARDELALGGPILPGFASMLLNRTDNSRHRLKLYGIAIPLLRIAGSDYRTAGPLYCSIGNCQWCRGET